jgi:hypothetical protein
LELVVVKALGTFHCRVYMSINSQATTVIKINEVDQKPPPKSGMSMQNPLNT